jgi:hypothetical protein
MLFSAAKYVLLSLLVILFIFIVRTIYFRLFKLILKGKTKQGAEEMEKMLKDGFRPGSTGINFGMLKYLGSLIIQDIKSTFAGNNLSTGRSAINSKLVNLDGSPVNLFDLMNENKLMTITFGSYT